jgi:Putative peptidoglycan binding domain
MRIFVVLICSLGLVGVAYGAQQEENKQQKKKQPQTVQHAPSSATGRPTGAGAGPKKTSMGAYEGQKGKKGQTSTGAYQGQTVKKGQTSTGAYQGQTVKKGQTSMGAYEGQKAKKGQTSMAVHEGQTGKAAKGGKVAGPGKPGEVATKTAGKTAATGKAATGKPFKPQHFNVPKQPNTAKAPPVKFQQGKHIEGSQKWQGQNYTVFRNYKSEWHDQNWWHSHHNRIVFVFGSPYYWNAGYWFPAWGYNPNAYYAWDGPIYGYNRLPPDQVIANVQAALQQQGYYQGGVDGLLGPLTRGAIADYQRDHGLYTTSTIDEPTLQSLGMA